MSRRYEVRFELPGGGTTAVEATGNTKRSAEGWARRELRTRGYDPAACVTRSITFVGSK